MHHLTHTCSASLYGLLFSAIAIISSQLGKLPSVATGCDRPEKQPFCGGFSVDFMLVHTVIGIIILLANMRTIIIIT